MSSKKMVVGASQSGLENDIGVIASHLDQFAQDTRFLESLRPELQKQHPDSWVAIYKKKVVSTGASLREIMQSLEKQGIPKSRAVVDYLKTDPITLIL